MARLHGMFAVLVLGSALTSRSAAAQHGASVNVTHTVTVTLPPRVRVQVANLAPVGRSVSRVSSVQTSTDGLAFSISATQPWTLSIGSAAKTSHLEWSHDRSSGFANVSAEDATVASGTIAQVPTAANVFFRNDTSSSNRGNPDGSAAVTLTVAAQ
ncbi:MAG: hypothetical protein NVSMB53_04090 [Gemmatimonadaceae bacterium]